MRGGWQGAFIRSTVNHQNVLVFILIHFPGVPPLGVPTRTSQALDLHPPACSLVLQTADFSPQLSMAPPRLPPAEQGTPRLLLGPRPSFQPLVGICGAEVSPLRGPFLSRLGGWALQQAVQTAALDQLASSGRPQRPTFRTPLLPQRATANSGSPLWASPSQGPLLGRLPNC